MKGICWQSGFLRQIEQGFSIIQSGDSKLPRFFAKNIFDDFRQVPENHILE